MKKTNIKELLEHRRKQKSKKPDFLRKDVHKKAKLGMKWRKPKGLHSKMRLKRKGHRKNVSPGYRAPSEIRNFSREGLKQMLVFSKNGLEKIDAKAEGIIIANVGLRNKIEIVKTAISKSIKIINIKEPEKFIKEIEEKIAKRKAEKEQAEKEKEKKQKSKEKKAEDKKKKEEKEKETKKEETLEEAAERAKKEEEEKKKEMDKALIQKEM